MKNLNFINKNVENDPYIILRGHTGPLYSLAQGPENSNIIYTAGNEGTIKVWAIPKQEDVAVYGDCDISINCNIGLFQKSNEVIWDLKHHTIKVKFNRFY